jgi:hypothetical protein
MRSGISTVQLSPGFKAGGSLANQGHTPLSHTQLSLSHTPTHHYTSQVSVRAWRTGQPLPLY